MDSSHSTKTRASEATIKINEPSSTKAKAVATTKALPHPRSGLKRGLSIFDFILRICALVAALAATATMGTTDQTLPFFTQFFQFQASYDDLPTFTYFVVANAIASGYLVLSLPFSIIGIVRPHLAGIKLLLLILDTIMVAFTTAAAPRRRRSSTWPIMGIRTRTGWPYASSSTTSASVSAERSSLLL